MIVLSIFFVILLYLILALISGLLYRYLRGLKLRAARILIVIYSCIILASLPAASLITRSDVPQSNRSAGGTHIEQQAEEAAMAVQQAIYAQQLPPLELMTELDRKVLKVNSDQLFIHTQDCCGPLPVFLRKNPQLTDQEIVVAYYSSPRVIYGYGYEYTHLLDPPKIVLNDNRLDILHETKVELKLVSLNKESYIEHFSQTNEKDADSSYIGYPEQEFVYLEVPPHLDVERLQGMLVKIEE